MSIKQADWLCIGHRGAKGYEPENTLRSIRKALALGVSWIEVDVYAVEHELLVIHDARLERTTNGKGYVEQQNLAYLRSLDAGKGEQIPLLSEVVDCINQQAGLNIELKGENTAIPVAKLIQHYLVKGRSADLFLVSSFNHRELALFRQLLPNIKIGALLCGLPIDNAAFAECMGVYSVNMSIEFIDRLFVEDAHQRGLKVFIYTVNHPEDIKRMYQLGVDGVFSDYPDRVLAFIAGE
ncbi:MAG: glycerophosphodiester phosphodiesterase family protein [Candidatus Thiocaldithrix dubininis]|uniref:Glycerophosphodiester phosphodiesterase family protein n=1 Tax=Candidatus Thiocaldithrix dubininis TaxID=3080823 RepID=A0AA95HC66_9GAMM|nr:MAG: glycerophosphodiester phosphodiesterase family protein [Candidatus Thiocaldithrix dubininis]